MPASPRPTRSRRWWRNERESQLVAVGTHIRSWRDLVRRRNLRVAATMCLAVALLSGAVYFRRIAFPTDNDFSLHVLYTQLLVEGKIGEIPLETLAHPGLQILLALMHTATFGRLGLYASLMIVQVAAQVGTALILYLWMGEETKVRSQTLRAFVAAGLTFVAPIVLIAPWDGLFYFGYIGLASYHNPTIHLLRPFALLSFILACRAFRGAKSPNLLVVAAGVLMATSLLIKPNYALCLLPAMAIVAWLRWRAHRPPDWRMLLFGFFLPASIVLLAQWAVGFWMARGEETGFLIRPLEVEQAFSGYLLPKFLLSIVFPVIVLAGYPRGSLREDGLVLAWLAFVFGAAQMYLLAESGDRFYHGNFRWGAQISLFLLFAASAKFLLQTRAAPGAPHSRRWVIGWAAFAAHLIAGAAYYAHVMVSSGYG